MLLCCGGGNGCLIHGVHYIMSGGIRFAQNVRLGRCLPEGYRRLASLLGLTLSTSLSLLADMLAAMRAGL